MSFVSCPLIIDEKLLFYYNYRPLYSVKSDAGLRNLAQDTSQPSISSNPVAKPRTVKHDTHRASAPHSAHSTTTANGVIITSNIPHTSVSRSAAHTIQPAVTVEYGGFSEEDESEERQAALSSPIKGRQILSSSVSISFVYFKT